MVSVATEGLKDGIPNNLPTHQFGSLDVQLTKDLVPVIYHDWTLTESGYDIPINAVTAEQFLNLRPSGQIKEYHQGVTSDKRGSVIMPTVNASSKSDDNILDTISALPDNPMLKTRVSRSNSMSALLGGINDRSSASKKLELTKTSKTGKLKGNGPESIQAPFTTLQEIFRVRKRLLLMIQKDLLKVTPHFSLRYSKYQKISDSISKSNTP